MTLSFLHRLLERVQVWEGEVRPDNHPHACGRESGIPFAFIIPHRPCSVELTLAGDTVVTHRVCWARQPSAPFSWSPCVTVMHISICDFLLTKWPLQMDISSVPKLIFTAYSGAMRRVWTASMLFPSHRECRGELRSCPNIPFIHLSSFPRTHCIGYISEVSALKLHSRNSKFVSSLRNPIFFKVPTYITFLSLLHPPLGRSENLHSSLHLKRDSLVSCVFLELELFIIPRQEENHFDPVNLF